jgi:hydroxymethylglutaryl-CoA lyase
MFSSILKHPPLRLFDVTLRDGLQSIPKIYSLAEKMDLGLNIIANRNPYAIEVGSIVSPKIVPQMKNSIELFQSFSSTYGTYKPIDIYVLTPNYKSVQIAAKNDVCNYSFITSVSNMFQTKNTNLTLSDTKSEIKDMVDLVKTTNEDNKIKLYISCFTECPIVGKIDNHAILAEIMYYYHTHGEQISNLCLSDTCGTLRFQDFKFIIDALIKKGVELKNFGLHLHKQSNCDNVKNIIVYGMKNGISQYDVSYMPEIGGCSVTMENPPGNVGYETIYECL